MKNRSGQSTHVQHCTTTSSTTVLETFPAAHPRGSWPAEEFAAERRAAGTPATVVMNLANDTFDVVKAGA